MTNKQQDKLHQKSLAVGAINNEERFFFVNGVKYEKTATWNEKGDWYHHIRNAETLEYKRYETLDDKIGDIIPTRDIDVLNATNKHK